jgi:hypothetical protein
LRVQLGLMFAPLEYQISLSSCQCRHDAGCLMRHADEGFDCRKYTLQVEICQGLGGCWLEARYVCWLSERKGFEDAGILRRGRSNAKQTELDF